MEYKLVLFLVFIVLLIGIMQSISFAKESSDYAEITFRHLSR